MGLNAAKRCLEMPFEAFFEHVFRGGSGAEIYLLDISPVGGGCGKRTYARGQSPRSLPSWEAKAEALAYLEAKAEAGSSR